jgi:HEAT repeat protein
MPVNAFLDQLASARDADTRIELFEKLGALGDLKAVGPLVQCLRHSTLDERIMIAETLGRLGDARAVAPLVSLLRDDCESVRGEAFAALLAIGHSRAQFMPPDAQGNASDDPRMALTQIAWPADLEAIQILMKAITDEDPDIRIGAAFTLGRLGIGAALDSLVRCLTVDSDFDVRAAAAFALGDLGEAGDSRVVKHLKAAWSDKSGDVETKVAILRSLGNLRCEGLASIFIEGASHPEERIRQLAAMGLGSQESSDGQTCLVNLLRDRSNNVRRIAIGSLAKLAQPKTIAPLIQSAIDAPAEIRFAVASALRGYSGETVVHALDTAMGSARVKERVIATFLLGQTGHIAPLPLALRDVDPQVRKAAALAIGSADAKDFEELLTGALTDATWFVRVAAAEGLKRLGSAVALDALAKCQDDENPVVRNAVKTAIETLSQKPRIH